MILAVTAPIAKAKAAEPAKVVVTDRNLIIEHNMYTWALHKCGDPVKAEHFTTWYRMTLQSWKDILRKCGDTIFTDPTRIKQRLELEQFEGQTFDNLWKLFNRSK